ncbi:DUF3122 domain-containing protein [Nodosilinea sp. AN01ver1]|uniref:DUF3122 domain-containing protein n=1 Tax=Nodosilinea sp. AN01ver1 TaxID=3423362 RepID=UPI003D31751E
MTYYFSKVVDASFEEAIAQVTESLQQEGFGVLTEIDAQAAFKKKLNAEFRPYKILGACHPQISYEMLQLDDKAGVLYPCNVVVQRHGPPSHPLAACRLVRGQCMGTVMRKFCFWLLLGAVLWLEIGLGLGLFNPASAAAAIRQLEEAPGQVVYQSRQPLQDRQGHSWQAIAFKRIRPDGSTSVALRLVGFPGVANLDHDQPLILTNSLGKTLTAADDSGKIFTDAAAPEPNVGQYDLQDLLPQLQTEIPLQLTLPTADGRGVSLTVPSALIAEWKTVAGYE